MWRYTKLYVAYNFGRDLEITSTVVLVLLIVSNIVSLVGVQITHQEIIIEGNFLVSSFSLR